MTDDERQRQLRIDSWGCGLGGTISATAGLIAGGGWSQVVLFIVAAVMIAASISAARSETRIKGKQR